VFVCEAVILPAGARRSAEVVQLAAVKMLVAPVAAAADVDDDDDKVVDAPEAVDVAWIRLVVEMLGLDELTINRCSMFYLRRHYWHLEVTGFIHNFSSYIGRQ
jgi:hypothetical protein